MFAAALAGTKVMMVVVAATMTCGPTGYESEGNNNGTENTAHGRSSERFEATSTKNYAVSPFDRPNLPRKRNARSVETHCIFRVSL